MDKQYTSVEEQVNYGLDSIDENRTIDVCARDLVYVHNTIGEMLGFFHNPDHYPDIAAVQKFMGSKNAGAFHLLVECYYRKLPAMLPEDIQEGLDEGVFDNPAASYYHQPWDENSEEQKNDG